MSTDTLTPPETETAPVTEQVTFMARSENQVLTRRKTRKVADLNGEWRVQTEDEWRASMEAANEKRMLDGDKPLEYDSSPWKIQFQQNIYRTDDPLIIAWLRKHDLFGFNGPSGFWEFKPPVDVNDLEPTLRDQLRALQEALMKHDPEEAEAVLKVEQETHNRPAVLEAAESAVESLRELVAGATGYADPNGVSPSTSSS
jgi:hypothetical protein